MGGTLALRMGLFVAAIVGFGRTRRTRLRFLNRYGWPRECRTASLIGGDRIESEGYREGGGEDRTVSGNGSRSQDKLRQRGHDNNSKTLCKSTQKNRRIEQKRLTGW